MNNDTENLTASQNLSTLSNEEICKAIADKNFAQFSTADMILMKEWLGYLTQTVMFELNDRCERALHTYTSLKAMLVSAKAYEGGE